MLYRFWGLLDSCLAAFVYALQSSGLRNLQILLKNDAYKHLSISLVDKDNFTTAVHEAIRLNREDALKLFLQSGIDPNLLAPSVPGGGWKQGTPLVAALASGTAASVRILLENGANPNDIGTTEYETPIQKALVTNRDSSLKVALLLQHGNVPLTNRPGTIGLAEWVNLIRTKQKGTLRLLADYGTSIDSIMKGHLAYDRKMAQLPDDSNIWAIIDEMSDPNRPKLCSARTPSSSIQEICLPVELRRVDDDLNKQYKQLLEILIPQAKKRIRSEQLNWIKKRNAACQLKLNPVDHDGWLSYVLSDQKTATCVIEEARKRIAFFEATAR